MPRRAYDRKRVGKYPRKRLIYATYQHLFKASIDLSIRQGVRITSESKISYRVSRTEKRKGII